MSLDKKFQFLKQNLEKRIEWFDNRQHVNKKKAFSLKMLAVSFSAATTILLGLKGFDGIVLSGINIQIQLSNLALILSALVTLFAAFDAFFNHRELWISYTVTSGRLKAVKSELEYITSDGEDLEEKQIDDIFRKYQSILEETNKKWQSLRNDKGSEKL